MIQLTFVNDTTAALEAQYGKKKFPVPSGISRHSLEHIDDASLSFGAPKSDLPYLGLTPGKTRDGDKVVLYFTRDGEEPYVCENHRL